MSDNNEIISRITAVINTLNNITVNGKQNLMNLCGCISVLEEVRDVIGKVESKDGE